MAVPLLDVPAQNGRWNQLQAAFLRVLQSGRYILGPEVHAFEEEMAADCGIRMPSGILRHRCPASGPYEPRRGPGDEVLCPSFHSCHSRQHCANGATPVFVDSIEDTFSIDVADAATKITHAHEPSFPYTCSEAPRIWMPSTPWQILLVKVIERRPSAGRTLAG